VAALVYGLSKAATGPDGTSHWGDASVLATLTVSVVLLAAFAVIETRSRHALMPVRLLRSRDRAGAIVMMLAVGTIVSGVFFFVTLFVQELWGYSPLRTGVAFLPFAAALLVGSAIAAQLVPRIGARPLLIAGAAASAGGLYWLSRMTEHGTYAGELLGAALTIGVGLGLLFVPLSLVALAHVGEADTGVASSLLNAGRQVGAAIGLAVLGTVAWTVVANGARAHAAAGGTTRTAVAQAAYRHALAAGFDRAFGVGAGIAVVLLVIAIVVIRVRRADLNGS
jgi:predicted MFS family arabinose efflux permease